MRAPNPVSFDFARQHREGRRMFRAISANSLAVLLGRTALFVVTLMLARALGPAQYGIYALTVAIIGFLTIPALAGVPDLITREVAAHRGAESKSDLSALFARALTLVAIMTSVIALAVLIVHALPIMAATSFAQINLATVLAALLLFAVIGFASGFLRGLGAVTSALLPRELVFGVVLVALIVASRPNAHGDALTLYLFAALVAAAYSLWLVRQNWPTAPDTETRVAPSTRDLISTSLPFAGISVLAFTVQRIDLLVLGAFSSEVQLGIYSIAVQLALIAGMPLAIYNGIAAPRIARAFQEGQMQTIAALIGSASIIMGAMAILGTVLFWLLGKSALGFVFGAAFTDAFLPCVILLIGQSVNLSCGPAGLALNMTGHERRTVKGMALGAGLSLVGCFVLVPPLGMVGAAIATASAIIAWNLYLSVQLYRALGIYPGPWARLTPALMGKVR